MSRRLFGLLHDQSPSVICFGDDWTFRESVEYEDEVYEESNIARGASDAD